MAEELNVRAVHVAQRREDFVSQEVRPNFRVLGKRLGALMPRVKAALEAAAGDELARALDESGSVRVVVDGTPIDLGREELEVRLNERPGMATAGDRDLLVALDTELTPALVAEGWAREVVHRIQSARKERELDYADRIAVRFRAGGELRDAVVAHRDWIAGETLATELYEATSPDGLQSAPVEGMEFQFTIQKV
jgi:isoleucyl-tRNA synthetase